MSYWQTSDASCSHHNAGLSLDDVSYCFAIATSDPHGVLARIALTSRYSASILVRLLLKIPPTLTSQEIAAIRSRKIFRGMSRRAVFYSWGVTEENDYGRGGRQLVYGDRQFVYLDNKGTVTDWQSVGR
jgi:hypothetical protein